MNIVERAHHTYPFGDYIPELPHLTGHVYPAGDGNWAMVVETDEHVLVDELYSSFADAQSAVFEWYTAQSLGMPRQITRCKKEEAMIHWVLSDAPITGGGWVAFARYEGGMFRAELFDTQADASAWLDGCAGDARFVSGMVGECRDGGIVPIEETARMQRRLPTALKQRETGSER